MINMKNITKSYSGKMILDDVSLKIPEGKVVILLGSNGVGKSTLLRLMAGSELPDRGEVTYKDSNVLSFDFPYTSEIGFVHEKLEYASPFTIEKFISYLSLDQKNWDQAYFEYLVKARKIDLKQTFQSYSRGQKMQIALMINLALKPKLLLLDEITSVIDVYGRRFFLEEIRKFADNGGTVVITTNIISELDFYSDHLIILKNEQVELNLPIEDVSTNFIKLRKDQNVEHKVFDDVNCTWAGVNTDRSVSYIVESNLIENYEIPDDMVDKRKSTLEDVFIYYFTKGGEK